MNKYDEDKYIFMSYLYIYIVIEYSYKYNNIWKKYNKLFYPNKNDEKNYPDLYFLLSLLYIFLSHIIYSNQHSR